MWKKKVKICKFCEEKMNYKDKQCLNCWSMEDWSNLISDKKNPKIRSIATVLALFGWWLWLHFFYLWKTYTFMGIFMIILFIIYYPIPMIIWAINAFFIALSPTEVWDGICWYRRIVPNKPIFKK